MSELTARHVVDVYDDYAEHPWEECSQVYLKTEADKVISDLEESHKMEVEQLLMEIVKLKDKLRHQKYKRCMAMKYVEWLKQIIIGLHPENILYRKAFKRERKWMELAEKFKEAK